VHVQIKSRESKAEFLFEGEDVSIIFKKVEGKDPLTLPEAKEISVFLKKNTKKIIEKWNQVFILHQKVDCEKVKQKLKRK
jgi:hypothetical protein